MNNNIYISEELIVEGGNQKSPSVVTTSTSTRTNFTDIVNSNNNNNNNSCHPHRSQMRKYPRRRGSIFTSQTKFIVVLLSLLYIGDKSINPNLATPPKGYVPGFGTLFVLGAASDDNDPEKNNNGNNSNNRNRMRNVMNVNAAPDVPIFRKKKEKTNNITDLKSHSFFGRKQPTKDEVMKESDSDDPVNQLTFSEILKKAGKSGIGGGISGAIAGIAQVLSLMWLRTVMNYQCRYGSTFLQAMRALNSQGGIPRFYRGMSFALIQAPLARFVATAANDGVETLLTSLDYTKDWGPGRSTVIASMVVGMWRILLMPIDTCKTVLQVDSVDGFRSLMRKVKAGKIYVLYQGGAANAISAIASHYPWFYTFRVLSHNQFVQKLIGSNHLRNALIGFTSSVISDTFANSIRVVKTAKQAIAAKHTVSYGEVIAMILAVDGFKGLFGRGLRTRIFGNALQSVLFTVIWRGLAERQNGNQNSDQTQDKRRSLKEDMNISKDHDHGDIPEKDVPLEEERF